MRDMETAYNDVNANRYDLRLASERLLQRTSGLPQHHYLRLLVYLGQTEAQASASSPQRILHRVRRNERAFSNFILPEAEPRVPEIWRSDTDYSSPPSPTGPRIQIAEDRNQSQLMWAGRPTRCVAPAPPITNDSARERARKWFSDALESAKRGLQNPAYVPWAKGAPPPRDAYWRSRAHLVPKKSILKRWKQSGAVESSQISSRAFPETPTNPETGVWHSEESFEQIRAMAQASAEADHLERYETAATGVSADLRDAQVDGVAPDETVDMPGGIGNTQVDGVAPEVSIESPADSGNLLNDDAAAADNEDDDEEEAPRQDSAQSFLRRASEALGLTKLRRSIGRRISRPNAMDGS